VRTAVVGHIEWVDFVRVDHLPSPGEILHPTETWAAPAGGGPVAAVQLERLAGNCTFFTALGDDEIGARARREMEALGLRVEASIREAPTRRAFTFIDRTGERTITTIGQRLQPAAADPLAWEELEDTDAVYLCAADAGAVREARRSRVLVATSRAFTSVVQAEVRLDALVGSSRDPSERFDLSALREPPRLVVVTEGRIGGSFRTADGRDGRYEAAPLPGPLSDTYGLGDSFAGGLTFALGTGWDVDRALELAARCGASCATGRGPYERQLTPEQ